MNLRLIIAALIIIAAYLSLAYGESCEVEPAGTNETKSCPNARSQDVLLSRRRRALTLPDGSNFIITLSLVKAILMGLPLGWNIALEIDIPYKAATYKDIAKSKFPRLRLHNKQRRELLRGMEQALNVNGFNGQACVLRTICEMQYFLAPPSTNFVHDILRILLRAPQNGGPHDPYVKASTIEDCNVYRGPKKCPYSFLDLIVNHATVKKY